VTLRIVRVDGGLRADGEIDDDARAPVARRIFTQPGAECASLARAVGVWASIVLDTELDRASAPPSSPSSPPPARPPSPAASTDLTDPSEDRGPPARNHDARGIDIGASTFLMGGTGTSLMMGPSVFSMIQVGESTYVRPAISYGRTIRGIDDGTDIDASWGAGRFDFCVRVVGAYFDVRTLQLDMCGGAEIGFVHVEDPMSVASSAASRTLPMIDLGPSVALNGAINSFLSLEIRGFGFVNLSRDTYTDPPIYVQPGLFGGRGEVAISWKLQ
jgi:hypothetical protein